MEPAVRKPKGRRIGPALTPTPGPIQTETAVQFNPDQRIPVISASRKGRRTIDLYEDSPRNDLSEEFQQKVQAYKTPERRHESPLVITQKDRIQKWREDSAQVSTAKTNIKKNTALHPVRTKKTSAPIKPKGHRGPVVKAKVRQSMEFIRSALSESQASEVLFEPETMMSPTPGNSRELLQIAKNAAAESPLVEQEPPKTVRLDTPNPMATYQASKKRDQEIQRVKHRSVVPEISTKTQHDIARGTYHVMHGTHHSVRAEQQNSQRPANLKMRPPEKPSIDMLSATTFDMPSASEAWMSDERNLDRAQLLYYNNRDSIMKREHSSVELAPTTQNLKLRSSRKQSERVPESQEGPGTQTSSGQGHRQKQVQLQWDYSSLKVWNLSLDIKTGDLHDLFPGALSVTKPVREVDPLSGDLVSYAFVLFSSTDDAAAALKKYHGRIIGGQQLRLGYRQFSTVR